MRRSRDGKSWAGIISVLVSGIACNSEKQSRLSLLTLAVRVHTVRRITDSMCKGVAVSGQDK